MANGTRVYLELGKKRVFACALDWPGWCRSGRDEADALETLAAYAPRYAVVAQEAGLPFPSLAEPFEVMERRPGSGVTDFGALDKPAAADHEPLTAAEAERLAALLAGSWQVFDRVVTGAPAELRKGPRGGGRDRDKVAEHVLGAETSYVRKLGVRHRQPALGDTAAIAALRDAVLEVVRAAREPIVVEKGWPVRYAVRRAAWHVLDHAWEIQDKSER
jgi:hypothetical protein